MKEKIGNVLYTIGATLALILAITLAEHGVGGVVAGIFSAFITAPLWVTGMILGGWFK